MTKRGQVTILVHTNSILQKLCYQKLFIEFCCTDLFENSLETILVTIVEKYFEIPWYPQIRWKYLNYEPDRIIIDNEAAICMAKCNKDTAGNRHVARRFHYVRQGTALKEHKFEWISSKFQLADILTKVGNKCSFEHLWSLILHQEDL